MVYDLNVQTLLPTTITQSALFLMSLRKEYPQVYPKLPIIYLHYLYTVMSLIVNEVPSAWVSIEKYVFYLQSFSAFGRNKVLFKKLLAHNFQKIQAKRKVTYQAPQLL